MFPYVLLIQNPVWNCVIVYQFMEFLLECVCPFTASTLTIPVVLTECCNKESTFSSSL